MALSPHRVLSRAQELIHQVTHLLLAAQVHPRLTDLPTTLHALMETETQVKLLHLLKSPP